MMETIMTKLIQKFRARFRTRGGHSAYSDVRPPGFRTIDTLTAKMMPDHRHSFQSDEPCPYCKKVGKHECNCFAPAQDILQNDLAKRLRSNYHPEYEGDCLLCEAADRIEQFEADVEWWHQEYRTAHDMWEIGQAIIASLEAENVSLKKSLGDLAQPWTGIEYRNELTEARATIASLEAERDRLREALRKATGITTRFALVPISVPDGGKP